MSHPASSFHAVFHNTDRSLFGSLQNFLPNKHEARNFNKVLFIESKLYSLDIKIELFLFIQQQVHINFLGAVVIILSFPQCYIIVSHHRPAYQRIVDQRLNHSDFGNTILSPN